MADDPEQLWHGALRVQIVEPRKEVPGAQDDAEQASSRHAFVTYGVRAETDLPHFSRTYMVTRKRFQDFVFLHHALVSDFPACIVPPLPDKHRIGYLTGDRFSAEFIARRCMELQMFMERVCRHPVLQRAKIVQQFLESKEWHIDMHTHAGHPIASSAAGDAAALTHTGTSSLLESMSDLFVNAFAHVRKPDARFVAIKADLEGEEDRATQWERVLLRNRMHRSDLTSDYRDLAKALEQLAVLETGMSTELQKTAHALDVWADTEAQFTFGVLDDMLTLLRAKQTYIHSHQALLKHRDSRQLDFEGLTDYLHAAVTERDRLAHLGTPDGEPVHGNVRGKGMRGYMRHVVDRVCGVDEEQARIERMQRLDARIDELQDAVSQSHTQCQAFNQQVAKEHYIYEMGRRREMQQTLRMCVDGHIRYLERGMHAMDELIHELENDAPSTSGDDATAAAGPAAASDDP